MEPHGSNLAKYRDIIDVGIRYKDVQIIPDNYRGDLTSIVHNGNADQGTKYWKYAGVEEWTEVERTIEIPSGTVELKLLLDRTTDTTLDEMNYVAFDDVVVIPSVS